MDKKDLSARWSNLSPAKRALLEKMLRREGAPAAEADMQHAPAEGGVPLSYAQQRLWFLDQYEPNSPLYNVSQVFSIEGPLNVPLLRRCLGEIVERHAALRTSFASDKGEPAQFVHAPQPFDLSLCDLRAVPALGREAEADSAVLAYSNLPFDLTQPSLIRGLAVCLEEERYVLVLVMHHIVSDGWSLSVLFSELASLYAARLEGRAPALEPLPIQYTDYAAWQREHLSGERLARQLDFWRGHLAGAPPVLGLPTDRPRPAVQSHNGARLRFPLDAELTKRLRALALQEGCTLFMVMLAAFDVLLWRYTGQADVVVGTPVANRGRREVEGLIGFFVNTLALRVRLDAGLSFRELVARAREATLNSYAHQELPFERLVEELEPERQTSHAPIFQVMFALQNVPKHDLELANLKIESLDIDRRNSKFDLSLFIIEEADGLTCPLIYNSDLFDPATIERMAAHYERLLRSIVADPSRRLSELSLLGDEERQQILVKWNDTAREYPANSTIDALFSEQARRTPHAVAVVGGERELSYAELDAMSDAVARRLRRLGVRREEPVGVLCERGVEMVAALLGVLKAGCAYVPFEVSYPGERIRYMLEDAGARVVVTQEQERGREEFKGLELLTVEEACAAGAETEACAAGAEGEGELGSSSQEEARSSDGLAYIIYTSGSTGRPKGVMVEHRNVLNLRAALREAVYANHTESRPLRASLNAPLSFDSSVKQWLQLLDGHTLCVVPEEARLDPSVFLDFQRRRRLDVLDCTPSQLRALLDAGLFAEGAESPRLLLVGGETIDGGLWRELAALPRTAVYNVYGPTECTVDATVGRVEGERPQIGRPLGNVRVYVLGAGMEVAPLGAVGELYVAGAGVARGYVGDASRTAERFVEWAVRAGGEVRRERVYRTGDLVRYLPDGRIEFIGRADEQVKVRGYRVELGEIEAALRQHPDVCEAAVVASGEAGGGKRLVGYVVGAAGAAPEAGEVRRFLRERLPDFMVPSVVVLEKLPLTVNGKIDRQALPKPSGAGLQDGYVAPSTEVEEKVTGIWGELLGVERVGVRDNFFDLGGHSLLAMRVASRLREEFRIEMPVRVIFETGSAARLARAIEGAIRSNPVVEQMSSSPFNDFEQGVL